MADTLPALLLRHAADTPDGIAHWVKRRGLWQRISWRRAARRTARAVAALAAAGVAPGDRVMLIGDPEPELHWAAWAVMALGASVVALDPAAKADSVASAVASNTVRCALVHGEEQAVKLAAVGPGRVPTVLAWGLEQPMQVCGKPVETLRFSSSEDESGPPLLTMRNGQPAPAFMPADSAGEDARAVQHAQLLETADALRIELGLQPGARCFAALPLAFGEAQALLALTLAMPMTSCFAESPDQLEANLIELQPDLPLMDHAFWTDAVARVRDRARAGPWHALAPGRAAGWLREAALHRPMRRHLGLGRAGAVLVAGGCLDETACVTFSTLHVRWLAVDASGRPVRGAAGRFAGVAT